MSRSLISSRHMSTCLVVLFCCLLALTVVTASAAHSAKITSNATAKAHSHAHALANKTSAAVSIGKNKARIAGDDDIVFRSLDHPIYVDKEEEFDSDVPGVEDLVSPKLSFEMLQFMEPYDVDEIEEGKQKMREYKEKRLQMSTAFYAKIESGDMKGLEEACTKFGPWINVNDADGNTPMMKAVVAENLDMVRLLVKYGARMSVIDANKRGNTPIMKAIKKMNLPITEYLVSASFSINPTYAPFTRALFTQNKEGKTPLLLALESGNADMVKLLLKNGCWKGLNQPSGQKAISLAAATTDPAIKAYMTKAVQYYSEMSQKMAEEGDQANRGVMGKMKNKLKAVKGMFGIKTQK